MATTLPVPAAGTTEKRDFRKEVTDSIIRMLEQGVAPWQKPWDSTAIRTPFNPTSDKPYRGGNALHLLAAGMRKGYPDPRWLTYKQAVESGWQVRKGEKGTQIEFWDFSKTEGADSREPTEATAGARASETGSARKDIAAKPLHRVYTVFNALQIDGIPEYKPKAHGAFEVAHAGEQILRNSAAVIHHDQRDRAFYNRVSDSIHLPGREAFRDAAGYYGTALHELAHWSGHPDRLNRSTLTGSYRFGDLSYAKEELRAEIASVFIAAERGIPHEPSSHAAYVGSWIEALRGDKHEIFRAAQDASKAADYILALERDRSMAEAIEAETPAQGISPDPTESPDQQAAHITEAVAAAKEPLRREIAELDSDRDRAGDRETTIRNAPAPEVEATPETSHPTANGLAAKSPGRESLASSFDAARRVASDTLGGTGRTITALTASGIYRGRIIGETEHHVVQQISGKTAVAHMKHALTPVPEVGESVVVAYSNSKAEVKDFHQRDRSQQLAR